LCRKERIVVCSFRPMLLGDLLDFVQSTSYL
jgi:hypothetical protein